MSMGTEVKNADLEKQIQELAIHAYFASLQLSSASTELKNEVLSTLADLLDKSHESILKANAIDLENAKKMGLSGAKLDRLTLNDARIDAMAKGVREVVALSDPVGEVMIKELPNVVDDLKISKIRVPIGVIGIIYESRPNVTIDAAILCLKTGNATILRGGSEAFESNKCLAALISRAARENVLPEAIVSFVLTADREAIPILCRQSEYIDLMIPRGGKGLIETVVEHARMPVIKHYEGICHMYVHEEADQAMAERLILNAKCQRPGVCNAIETLLIDRAIAEKFVPKIVKALEEENVKIFAEQDFSDICKKNFDEPPVKNPGQSPWMNEYLDLRLSVKIVDGVETAIAHIEQFGSHHSDAIITKNKEVAEQFLSKVDSATVYWNASTRFTDGGCFGFGAEIGISTDKIHARGPMALEELTSYKYVIRGTGQARK